MTGRQAFNTDELRAIKSKINLRHLLRSRGTDLGRDHKIKCLSPDHDDRTASMSVYPDGLSCFGCGFNEDVFWLLQQQDGLSFPEAVRVAADLAGVTLNSNNGTLKPDAAAERWCRSRAFSWPFIREHFDVHAESWRGRQGSRAAIRYPTPTGVDRLRFLDGDKPKYRWAATGGKAHVYGAGAVAVAEVKGVIYIVNGEPSVWALASHKVPAICFCGGENALPDIESLRALLTRHDLSARIVYDNDTAGLLGAFRLDRHLSSHGINASVGALPIWLGESSDAEDYVSWLTEKHAPVGQAMALLGPRRPPLAHVLKPPADASTALTVPCGDGFPWELSRAGLFKRVAQDDGPDKLKPLTRAPLVLTRQSVDIDTGEITLRAAFTSADQWRHVDAPRADLLEASKITRALAGQGAPVSSANARSLVNFFAACDDGGRLPSVLSTTHLGWQGKDGKLGFAAGDVYINPDGHQRTEGQVTLALDDGAEQNVAGLHPEGDLPGWVAAVAPLRRHPVARFLVYAALAAPLLGPLSAPPFLVDLSGLTSTGKTTALRVAASVAGDPRTIVRDWNATQVGIERIASTQTDIPLILDDSKTAKHPKDVPEFVYSLTSSQGRDRGRIGGMQVTRRWLTVVLSSGEAPLSTFDLSAGTRARMIEIGAAPFGDENSGPLIGDLDGQLAQHYGHALPALIQSLVRRDDWRGKQRALYRQSVTDWAALAASCADKVAARISSYFAIVERAALLAHTAIPGLREAWGDPLEVLAEIWAPIGSASAVRERDMALAAAASVVDRCGRERDRLYSTGQSTQSPPGGWYGRWDQNPQDATLYLFPDVLAAWLDELGHNVQEVLPVWRRRGWLDCDGDRFKRQMKFAPSGHWHRVYAIDPSKIPA